MSRPLLSTQTARPLRAMACEVFGQPRDCGVSNILLRTRIGSGCAVRAVCLRWPRNAAAGTRAEPACWTGFRHGALHGPWESAAEVVTRGVRAISALPASHPPPHPRAAPVFLLSARHTLHLDKRLPRVSTSSSCSRLSRVAPDVADQVLTLEASGSRVCVQASEKLTCWRQV